MSQAIDVLIVAAGRGTRAKREDLNQPKQYVPLRGQAVLTHTIERFYFNRRIRYIQTVIHPDDQEAYTDITASYSDKLLPPVTGGADRQSSVYLGLQALTHNAPDIVMIHDGVRPFVSEALLDRLLSGHETAPALIPVLPIADTLKHVTDGQIRKTIDRTDLCGAQTPQSFQFDKIMDAHSAAAKAVSENSAPLFTDDASIAEWYGLPVAGVAGEPFNIKITVPEDFEKGEWILGRQDVCNGLQTDIKLREGVIMDVRVGQGFDVHAFEEGDHVILCGVSIPHEKKLKGHSDADVGLHALTDALYGAIGEGDIGTHFPPSEEMWRGAASDQFLIAAAQAVRAKGGVITHVDVTLICERPKIGPHAADMKDLLGALLSISVDRVSVKATTSEKLGFTGRGEGIAAMASATVVFPPEQ